MKQRLFLSVLGILFLMYDAMPRFEFSFDLEGAFFGLWVLFALIALGGNLAGLVYSSKLKKLPYPTSSTPKNSERRQYSR
ncbi:hypothetical protein [Pseudalkalibacillus caeni]|uniref:Uncharacterized protein n=1 Tax=Exobacillus caeni TaxID=2574798 RepID=A0A5R9FEW0_9BACL|nr:hypothetical protein [Pseudalkalibacillus caeni]TLS39124.1 hypothetical protein FCL54_02085 [Pseudalkalibacillus caeni]